MPDVTITCEGIAKLLLNLNPNKAAGTDEIKPRVLKELATEIAPILTILFQISLESGVVPSDWKTAHVAPVYKKGPKYNPENYRPISLACICCKLLEHIVVSNIMSHDYHYHISSLNSLPVLYIFLNLFLIVFYFYFFTSFFASQFNDIIFKLLK